MNGGRRRRIPMMDAVSLLLFVLSAVTAQQVFDGNRQQPGFVRQQPRQFQQPPPSQVSFQQNRNFAVPSASPLRHRSLFTRQISHRHRPRHRSFHHSSPHVFRNTTTHQPSSVAPPLTPRRIVSSSLQRLRTKTVTRARANQRTTRINSNISRRQQFFVPSRQQFRFVRPQPRPVQQPPRLQPAFVRGSVRPAPVPSLALRAPLSPMPFGSVQRPIGGRRLPQNNLRLSLRPPTPPPTPPVLSTTTSVPPIPSSPTPSSTSLSPPPPPSSIPTGSLRRPIRVEQLSLNLRRKPQLTRGISRRPTSSNLKSPLNRHQPTHRVLQPDRVTRPITTTESTTTVISSSTESAEFELRRVNHLKQVDDIEAAILAAVAESSSPAPTLAPSSTHRPRRIRPGHRRPRPLAPTRVDSIEEAVLRAVLEATPPAADVMSTTTEQTTATSEELPTTSLTTTTENTEVTSLFPAFATRKPAHRRTTSAILPTTMTLTTSEVLEPTTTSEESTTAQTTTIETTTTSEGLTTVSEEPTTTSGETTTTSEDLTTTSEELTTITIPIPEEEANVKKDSEDRQLHQIEQNIISALTTPSPPEAPTSSSPISPTSSESPAPPAPLPPTTPSESAIQVGPPGSMPPSDDIVDELNGSSDFLQVAQRLHLLRRLLQ